jgi:hypothetical protein
MTELKVGQKLWYVPSYVKNRAHEVIISKIGKKWAYDSRAHNPMQIHKETLVVPGTGSTLSGRCYLSKQEYEDMLVLESKWTEFYRKIYVSVPKDMTLEKLEKIEQLIWG